MRNLYGFAGNLQAMAHYLKFFTALAFSVVAIACYLIWPGWAGVCAFVGLFIIGSMASSALFKRYATLEEVKEDLEARLHDT